MSARRPVRALLVEDSDDDATLILLQLRKAGFDVTSERVDTLAALDRALDARWDVVLTDHSLPGFSSEQVLGRLRDRRIDTPCIIVSGRIGEEAAVQAMRAGAADYVSKHTLSRLDPAVSRALREAEERRARKAAETDLLVLDAAVQEIAEGVVIATADPAEPKVVYVNSGWCALTGVERASVLGKVATPFGGPWADREGLARVAADAQGKERLRGTSRRADGEGRDRVVEWQLASVREQGRATHFVTVEHDITERVRAQEALRESEERYALAARGARDGLWDWDLVRDELYLSSRWKGMLGWADDEIGTSPKEWLDRVQPADRPRVEAELRLHLEGLTEQFESEHRMRHKDGTWRWMLVRGMAVRDASGRALRIAGSQTDITAHKEVEEQLAHGALHDALTGLPNRVLFVDRARHAIRRAGEPGKIVAVLFLDLDRFKLVNDSLGHAAGDQMLVEAGRRIESSLRAADTVARMGGDEFAILLEDLRAASQATRIASNIQRALSAPFVLKGRDVYASASIGIALSVDPQDDPADLLRDADTAMYRAKALGKARHVVFDSAMHDRAVALLQLETDLRRAIGRGELRVMYQPVVSLKTGRVTGVESLVRWDHPTRGTVGPAEFVPVAEETGLILPIGELVLRRSCRQLRQWHAEVPGASPFSVSVNLSGRQLVQSELLDMVRSVLREEGVRPGELRVEVTESALIENADLAVETLEGLRGMAVRVSLDDFGTGYSSLSYLHRFPVDTIKIDKSFVERLGAGDTAIVATIAALAENLGMETVAEGVETVEQAEVLRTLHCTSAQGFLFARPLEAEAITVLLRERHRYAVLPEAGIPEQ